MAPFYVVLFALIATANANLFPSQYEFVYDYEAKIQASIQKPTPYTSEYFISAKVVLARTSDGVLVKLNNLTHTMYSGKLQTSNPETNWIGLNNETDAISKPFVIQYNTYGRIMNVLAEKEDELWSVNIKKAIASLIQIDTSQIDSKKSSPYFFTSEEQTVLGDCQVSNIVEPKSSRYQYVTKYFTTDSCKDFKLKMKFNTNPVKCTVREDQPLIYTGERFYEIQNDGNTMKLTHIEGFNTIVFTPLNDDSNPHTILINQTLNEISAKKIDSTPKTNMKNVQNYKIKTDVFVNGWMDENVYNLTADRNTVLAKVRNSLRNIHNYLNKNRVRLSESMTEQQGNINFLIRLLKSVSLEHLTDCYNELNALRDTEGEQMQSIFLQALSLTGTRASADLIFKIIKERKVDDSMAVKILQEVPHRVKHLDKTVLKNFVESVLEYRDVSMYVKNTAILVFGSMISKLQYTYPENDAELLAYVEHLIDTVKKTDDYKTKVLYLSTLKNIEGNKAVTEFLESLVRNQTQSMRGITPHLRVLSMWGLEPSHVGEPDRVEKIYWPILVNRMENLEVREAALQLLVRQVDMNGHIRLYNYMKYLRNTELYASYYNSLVNLMKSGMHCNRPSAFYAKKMLTFVRQPAVLHQTNLHDLIDVVDPNLGFPSANRFSVFGNLTRDRFMNVFMEWSPQTNNAKFLQLSVYLHIEMKESFRSTFMNSVRSADDLKKILQKANSEDLIVEYIRLKYNKVVSVLNFNGKNLEDMLEKIVKDMNPASVKYEVEQFADQDVVLPTDLGVPATFFVHTPVIRKIRLLDYSAYQKNQVVGVKVRLDNALWHNHRYGIAVYNPLLDVWHGNRKTVVTDVNIPVNLIIGINVKQMKLEVKLIHDQPKNVANYGFQTHINNQVFTFNLNSDIGDLKKVCSRCVPVTVVTKGQNYRKKHTIQKSDNYEYSIFDCERKMSPVYVNTLKNIFLNNIDHHKNDILVPSILAISRQWSLYDMIYPEPEMCGIGLQIKSNQGSDSWDSADSTENVSQHGQESGESYTSKWKHDEDEYYPKESRINSDEYHPSKSLHTISESQDSNENDKTAYDVVKEYDAMSWYVKILSNPMNEVKVLLKPTRLNKSQYKICIKSQNINNGQWSVSIGDKNHDECDEDEKVLHISLVAKKWQESSLHYEYDVKIDKVNSQSEKILRELKEVLLHIYSNYHVRTVRTSTRQITDDMKLIVDEKSQSVNVFLITRLKSYQYERIPLEEMEILGIVPSKTQVNDNKVSSKMCEVKKDQLVNVHKKRVNYHLTDTWERLAGDCSGRLCKWEVSVKQSSPDQTMMIRVKYGDETLTINPKWGYQVTYEGKTLPHMETGYYNGPWFNYKVIQHQNLMVLKMENLNLRVEENGEGVKLLLPSTETLDGLCYETSNNMKH